MKEIADIIADTREYIERHGWWRGALRGPNGRQVCTVGGIYRSQGWTDKEGQREHSMEVDAINLAMVRALQGQHPQGQLWNRDGTLAVQIENLSIIEWNDSYATGKQEVLDILAKAEKIERAGFDPDA